MNLLQQMMRCKMKKVIDMDAWKKKHTYKSTKPKKFFFDNYTEEEIKK